MSSSDSKMHVYDETNKVWLKAIANSQGVLKCDTTLDKTGLATDTLQTTGNASLSSMDGKIISCDTGNVVVASGAITETNSAAIAGSLANLDGNVTVCNTDGVVIISGSITETNSGSISGSASSIDGKITQGSDASLVSAQQVVVYGRDSAGGLDALKVDAQGHLEVIMDEASNKGSHENLAANITLNSGAYSSVVNVNDMNVGNLFYEDSSVASYDTLAIEVSVDGTNYFKYTDIYPADDGSGSIRLTKETALQLQGLKNLRLINLSFVDNYTNVKATVVGSP